MERTNQWLLREWFLTRILQGRELGLELPDCVVLCHLFCVTLDFDAGLLFVSLGHNRGGGMRVLVLGAGGGDHGGVRRREVEGMCVGSTDR